MMEEQARVLLDNDEFLVEFLSTRPRACPVSWPYPGPPIRAISKSFWPTLKNEFYDRRRWVTRDEARREVARWIEVFYNRQRRHSALGFIPPVQFEQDHARPV